MPNWLLPKYLVFGEVTFTMLKSITLCIKKRNWCLNVFTVFCYVVESIFGIIISFLLAANAWIFSSQASTDFSIPAGVIIILITELVSVVTEGSLIRSKLKNAEARHEYQGKLRRNLVKWLAFTFGTGTLTYPLVRPLLKVHFEFYSNIPKYYLSTTIMFLLCNVIFMTLSCLKPSRIHVRLAVSVCYLGIAVLATLLLLFQKGEYPYGNFNLKAPAAVGVFSAALSSDCTAVSAWGLPNIDHRHALNVEHVKMFETVSFGTAGPAIIMGMNDENQESLLQIVMTILPQAGAVFIPFLVSYAVAQIKRFAAKRAVAEKEQLSIT